MMMMNRDALYEYSDDEKDATAIARTSSFSRRSGSTYSHGTHHRGRDTECKRNSSQVMSRESAGRKARVPEARVSMRRSSAGAESFRGSLASDNTSSSGSCETSSSSPPDNVGRHKIALFGGSGKVGQAFLHHALDAGYHVRNFVTNATSLDERHDPAFDDIATAGATGAGTSARTSHLLVNICGSSLSDTDAIEETLREADFVVCLLNDTVTAKTYPSKSFLSTFVQRLYPLMKQVPSIQLFVLQSTSLAADMLGATPVLSKLFKVMAHATGRTLQLVDHDSVMEYLATEHGHRKNQDKKRIKDEHRMNTTSPHFHFLVTRPTVYVRDGPASKRLCASKSQPGPFSITTGDLADFTLNVLLDAKLYDSCPYVVSANGL